jgi:Bacterial Ig domain
MIAIENYNTNVDNTVALASSSISSLNKEDTDIVPPAIKIIDPSPQSTIPSSEITVNGTAFDSGSGIKEVEAFAHTYPFNNVFNFKKANLMPEEKGGGLKWSISLPFNSTGICRILVHAIDNAGNENWDETRINIPFFANSTNGSKAAITPLKNIALVIPTFTEAAYSTHAFYTFYDKYHLIPWGKAVITDLDMFSAPIDYTYIDPYSPADTRNITLFTTTPIDQTIINLAEHLGKIIPNNALLSIIRDEDIHNGYIFNSGNTTTTSRGNIQISIGKNVYDTLVLFHDEYATQSMYNNYKRFVSNGGTIIFVDANVFIAEVNYNKANHTITFVKGHGWKFDGGKSAIKNVDERWFNENAEWVGSNFLTSDIANNISFSNNPFNYTHFEENFVNNPQAKVLIDYGAVVPKNSPYSGFVVASYDLSYGKGKVIMTGLYGQKLLNNKSFLKMLEGWILN